jgi:hypothetical protein
VGTRVLLILWPYVLEVSVHLAAHQSRGWISGLGAIEGHVFVLLDLNSSVPLVFTWSSLGLYIQTDSNPGTYGHRLQKARVPVRSLTDKLQTGGLVVRWVTTSESPLLYVFVIFLVINLKLVDRFLDLIKQRGTNLFFAQRTQRKRRSRLMAETFRQMNG